MPRSCAKPLPRVRAFMPYSYLKRALAPTRLCPGRDALSSTRYFVLPGRFAVVTFLRNLGGFGTGLLPHSSRESRIMRVLRSPFHCSKAKWLPRAHVFVQSMSGTLVSFRANLPVARRLVRDVPFPFFRIAFASLTFSHNVGGSASVFCARVCCESRIFCVVRRRCLA